jgi:phenylacetate-CoA ligase
MKFLKLYTKGNPDLTLNSMRTKKQFRKLRRVVRFAYRHSAFYRNLYDQAGFHPLDLKSPRDLQKIPVVSRGDLQAVLAQNPESLYTRKITESYWSQQTSGSTGVPIRIAASRSERFRIMLSMVRIYRHAGMRLSDQVVVIKDPIDIRKHSMVERIGIMRHDYFSIYEPMESIIASIQRRKRRVDILKSMPSDLANFVYSARRDGIQVRPPRMIFSDSETLDNQSRRAIENYFGVPLVDFYANTETGIAAFQTPWSNGRYLIPRNTIILETVSNELLGTNEYEIILTGLINKTTPIIRYRIGDICDGPVAPPTATRSFASLGGVHGKYLDFLIKNDGSVVSSHVAKQNMTHLTGIKRFQISQQTRGALKVLIEPTSAWKSETQNIIREMFARDFGSDLMLEIILVDDLSKSITMDRKFKVVHSSIAQELLSESLIQKNQ